MHANLEDELTRTLNAAGVAAPGPEPQFAAGVAGRRRGLRRTRTAGLAAVAAVALTISGGVTTLALDRGAPPDTAADAPAVDLRQAPPAEKLWAGAIVTLPGRLPDGRPMTVHERIEDDRYLVVPSSEPKGYNLPVVYNARTREARELTTAHPPGLKAYDYAGAWVADTTVLWIISVVDGSDRHSFELWSMPKAGGAAARRAVFRSEAGNPPQIGPGELGGVFYASVRDARADTSKIYRLPDRGEPQPISGTEGWVLGPTPWAPASAPWAHKLRQSPRLVASGSPSPNGSLLPMVSVFPPADPNRPAPTYWNLATGERRTGKSLPGVTDLDCAPETCVGRNAAGDLVSYRFDGQRLLRATGWPDADANSRTDAIFGGDGRFVQLRLFRVGTGGYANYLWDRSTNTAGRLDEGVGMTADLIQLGRTGDQQRLLDLSRIR